MVFVLGRQLHSVKAGLIAAGFYALWLPNVIAVWSTMQEALYIPLFLFAFVLFTHAMTSKGGYLAFGFSGVVFGLAALTRSIPVYFVVPAGLLYVATSADRKHALRGATSLLIGFALVTIPYSVALSMHLGEATFIENHGGLKVIAQYGGTPGQKPPGLVETAGVLLGAFVTSPGEILSNLHRTARSVFYVNGGRLLQTYLAARTHLGAVFWKIAAHLSADLFFMVSFVLAPFGLIFAKRWRVAAVFALWIAVSLSLTTLSGFGGARQRAPFEPHMVVLAAVVLAGRYPRRNRVWFSLSSTLAVVSALTVFPQFPKSLEARGDYGVRWSRLFRPKATSIRGEAGFNLLPSKGILSMDVIMSAPAEPQTALDIKVYLNERLIDETLLKGGKKRLKYEWPRLELVFVELIATDRTTGDPAELAVRLGR